MTEDDILTFDELRTVQNEERSTDTLQDLDEGFFARARDYLALKQDPESHLENREYRNARRVIEDIVDQRQKKIMKLAFLSVKSDLHVENLLPREEDLFEQVRDIIRDHRGAMQDRIFTVDGDAAEDAVTPDPAEPAAQPPETEPEDNGEADDDAAGESSSDPVEAGEEPVAPDPDSGDGATIFGGGDDTTAEAEESAEAEDARAGNVDEQQGDDGVDRVHIRIAESVPAFMGTDLEPYGPYDPGDETRVPEKNASILIEKEKAERVE